MEVIHCKSCGRLFNYLGGQKICVGCKDELEKKFLEVRDYIRDNKDASINEVSETNEVAVQQIRQWIREERLMFSDTSPVGIDCESCGAMIKTGKYCERCKAELTNNLGKLYKKEKPPTPQKDPREKARMRFLDN